MQRRRTRTGTYRDSRTQTTTSALLRQPSRLALAGKPIIVAVQPRSIFVAVSRDVAVAGSLRLRAVLKRNSTGGRRKRNAGRNGSRRNQQTNSANQQLNPSRSSEQCEQRVSRAELSPTGFRQHSCRTHRDCGSATIPKRGGSPRARRASPWSAQPGAHYTAGPRSRGAAGAICCPLRRFVG
jgi:hypothetical protein